MRTILVTAAAMVGFAANSLLCRAALRADEIDAATFTAIRLSSGALVLVAILAARGASVRGHGSWASAAYLAAYAIAFSYAYVQIDAGAGALLLFGAVQLSMIVGGLVRGERPSARQWLGLACATGGLLGINAPGLEDAPPLRGAMLMLGAGVAWGFYSLRGRGVSQPLAATAGNFARCVPIAAALALVAFAAGARATPRGVLLALASGGVASGLGYSLWYAVVPELGATRAAIVQLSVPVIAAAGAVALLGEPLRLHVALGGAAVLGGIALAIPPRGAPAAPAPSRSR